MNKLFTWTTSLLILVVGCSVDGNSPAVKNSASSAEQRGNMEPQIVLRGTKITYNGKPLQFGETLNEWLQVTKEQPRDPEKGVEYLEGSRYILDRVGIKLVMRHSDKTKVTMIDFSLNRRPINPYVQEEKDVPGNGINPLSLFQGYLEVDGVQIRQDSTVREVNEGLLRAGSKYHLHCSSGINICLDAITEDGIRITLGADTDSQKDDGVLYSIGIEDGAD